MKEISLTLDRRHAIAQEMENVTDTYFKLVLATESALEHACPSPRDISRFSQVYMSVEVATVAELVDQLTPLYFLDYALLEKIISFFLKSDQSMVRKLSDYIHRVKEFKSSTTVKQFMEIIETAQQSLSTPETPRTCTVILSLAGGWLKKTITDLEKLLKELFQDKIYVLTYLKIRMNGGGRDFFSKSPLMKTSAADDKPQLNDLQWMMYTVDGKIANFRLMDQLRPHSRHIAIALKFPHLAIDAIENENDPILHVLTEWLSGTNQEADPRPVTWRTLITVLREANVHEEANMLEKYMIEPSLHQRETQDSKSQSTITPTATPTSTDTTSQQPGDEDHTSTTADEDTHTGTLPDAVGTQNRNLVKQYIERQGSLPVRSLKSFLIGPPCVGKTSARRRLMGEIEHISADEIVPSTGINAPLTVRIHHPTEHSSVLLSEGWHNQGLEEQCRALCSYALNSPTPPPVLSSSTSAAPPPPVSPNAASHITKPVSKLTGLFKQAFSRHSQPTVATTQDAAKSTHDTATAAQDELTTALTTLVKDDDWKTIRDFLTNVKELAFLNIVDIGGQPEFHEILPLLLHGLALNLIFLNTTQDLDSPYTVVYRDGCSDDSPQYTSESTIRQVIQRALCIISSLQTSDEENKSAAILIGTYCDLADKSAVLALDQSIQDSFKEADFMKKDVLCAVNKPGEKRRYIYPLDNVSGDPSEIDKLRHL